MTSTPLDDKKIEILNTYRIATRPVGGSMATAKRVGPDFLCLSNAHSSKSFRLGGEQGSTNYIPRFKYAGLG
jgi:hypothetical protein